MDRLLDRMAGWRPFGVLVVGDFMLDELVFGDAERLSADAPVPVLHAKRTEHHAGGAGSLCRDLAAMGGRVFGVGVVGDDRSGGRLREVLGAEGIEAAALITDESRPTTVKRNLIGLAQQRHPQKMFRVDHESREPIAGAIESSLLEQIEKRLADVDVVCIEDYAKGLCTPRLCESLIRLAREAGKPVLVDPPSSGDLGKFRGATAITPNRNEAEAVTGMKTCSDGGPEQNAAVASRLLESLALEAVVLTLDRHGALLLEAGAEPAHLPTLARDVYDVTGAGDMMLAGLAAARANGFPWADAVRFANVAAGLEVEVFGVEPIPLERIKHQIAIEASGSLGKVRTRETLAAEVDARRSRGERIVFTNGCFDVLHSGHVKLLEEAARHGEFLIVAINDDASVRRLKGSERPVNTQDERARVLAALAGVDAVVVYPEDTPEALLELLRPDVLVKGGDYSRDRVVGADYVESYGGRVALIDPVPGRSSSATIERIKEPK